MPADTPKNTPATETPKKKATVILPKVKKIQGGFRPGGQPGAKDGREPGHAQTHDRKPPRLPGRNG